MTAKELFKQDTEAKMAGMQAELIRYKNRGMGLTAEAKKEHDKIIEELERKFDQLIEKLRNLEEAEPFIWQDRKDNVKSSLDALHSALKNAIETFEKESAMAGSHGEDDGAYPYGDLTGRSVLKKKLT